MPKRMLLATAATVVAALIAGPTLHAAPAPTEANGGAAAVAAAVPAAGLSRFPTFGVAFAAPAGWSRIPNDKFKTVAQWVSADSKSDDYKSLITVEAGVVIGPSLEQVASKLAQGFNGQVLE